MLLKEPLPKYHSGGLWTNTCCSHPRPDESMEEAVRRKLLQEIGIEALPTYSHKFIYKTTLEDLVENEMDYVYVGQFDGEPVINEEEVGKLEVHQHRRTFSGHQPASGTVHALV